MEVRKLHAIKGAETSVISYLVKTFKLTLQHVTVKLISRKVILII